MSNSNWIETDEGWIQNEKDEPIPGVSPFDQPIPPVRDADGFPLLPGGGVDWNKVLEEKNQQ